MTSNVPTADTLTPAADVHGRQVDVVVVGGGAAGLSGALMLARARRDVLVVDAGSPRNAPADGVHGLLAREGMSPLDLVRTGRAEVRSYGGTVVAGTVGTVLPRPDSGFDVRLTDGTAVVARRLLVTTGLVDDLPDLPGLREQWGKGVVHCPYCHGWEVRDQPIGILATGPMSVHQALLFRQWSDDIVLFTGDLIELSDQQREELAARGTRVETGPVAGLDTADGRVTGVRLADGSTVARSVVAVAAPMRVHLDFLAGVGPVAQPHPSGMGDHLPVDTTGRTTAPGIWAAGNVTDPSAQVGAAAAAAAFAAAQLNLDLVQEETRAAVEAFRQRPVA